MILLAPWAAYAAAPWPMTRLMLLRSVRAAARGRSAQEMAGGVERCPECGKEIASQWARLAPVSLWWRWLAPCVAGMAVVLFAACDWRWEQWSYPDDPSKLTGTTGKTYADVLAEADDDPASVGAAIAGGFPTSTMRPTDDAALVFQFQPASQLVSSEIAVGWPMPAVRRSVLTRFSRAIPPEQLPMKDSIDGVFDGKVTMWSGTAMSFHPSGGDPMENVSYTVDFGGAAITIVVAVLAGVLVRVGFAAHRGLTAFRRRWSGLCVGCGYRLWSPVELFPPVIATTAGGADAE